MTTFEAVSAHWPRQTKMKSTQRSRRSAKASSVHIPSSPTRVGSTPPKQAISSPRQPATRNGSLPYGLKVEVIETFDESIPPNNEDLDEDEEDNPFDILNMTQRYTEGVPEVNPSYIQRNAEPAPEEEGDDDDPDRDQQLHEQDAQQHAKESARVRATQVQRKEEDERSEYDDEEIDELFRQTVNVGFTTPTKGRSSPSITPTSIGSGSTLASRKARRDQRMREQAGLGDLRYFYAPLGKLTAVQSWIDLPFPYHLQSHSTMPSQRLLSLIHRAIK
jgi:DNA polymerase zeta